jgi:poly-gamma-glutamate capsule biosynthesis protein CapA/YwtB (metallophosphatase superfamily)
VRKSTGGIKPLLTIDEIFPPRSRLLHEEGDAFRMRVVLATGDIMPSRLVDQSIRRHGPDHPFVHVHEVLHHADLVLANLEAPLAARCRLVTTGNTFCGLPAFAQAMANAGIDVVTLENNHVDNYGRSGLSETKHHLEAAGIDFATASRLAVRDVRGLKIGILAFNGVGRRFDGPRIRERIRQSRPLVDLLLVAFHWGKEYVSLPEPCPATAPDDPRLIGRIAIEHGADLVIGNHPHWVQGVEFWNGRLITYSHGNFVFDQFWSTETRQGIIGKYTFFDTALIAVEYLPVFIDESAQPRPATGEEGAPILRRMEGSSIILQLS